MKITTKEMQLCAENGWYVGPTFAYCNNPDRPDYGSLIMNTSIFNGSDSGVGNLMFRSYDEGETWTEEGFIEKSFMSDRFGSMNKVGGNDALYADSRIQKGVDDHDGCKRIERQHRKVLVASNFRRQAVVRHAYSGHERLHLPLRQRRGSR